MFVELLDGPSKTAKTSIGRHLKEVLSLEVAGEVRLAIAGEFFRKLGILCAEEVGDAPAERELRAQLIRVIASEQAFDEQKVWGDLQSELADTMSSRVGALGEAQEAMGVWYGGVTGQAYADDVELLIIDARNPRQHITRELARPDTALALDLFNYCGVDIAAQRMNPPVGRAAEYRQKIIDRRRSDEVRPDFPMQPERWDSVPFTDYTQAAVDDVVASMWRSFDAPAPVYFDNEALELVPMLEAATLLSRTALVHAGCAIIGSNV